MIGSYAFNFHEGSRSEVFADYLFSAWGTVTPVRRQDDHGLDLYCTLADKIDQRAVVREYFVVQVKSNDQPWIFDHPESVRWLVEYPSPLFLAVVEKKKAMVSIYHVMPRFLAWAYGHLPERLELRPEQINEGVFSEWGEGGSVSLSAPILRVTLSDLVNDDIMQKFRDVFAYWVALDRENCDLVRNGLLRFRMPMSYCPNELPEPSVGEMGYAVPERSFLSRGIAALAESAECIGGQMGRSGDLAGALRAALLVDHLQSNYGDLFKKGFRWPHRVPGMLGMIVCDGLNNAITARRRPEYRYEGLDAAEEALENSEVVSAFLSRE